MANDAHPPVAVVGAGLVGRAWAIAFARAGHPVRIYDAAPAAGAAAVAFIRDVLEDLAKHDQLNQQQPKTVLDRIATTNDLSTALTGVVHVQESAPEDLSLKRALFFELDRHAPAGVPIASSTSALVPSLFTEQLPGRDRCLVAHPINPPYLVPAVELVAAPWTSPDVVERTRRFMLDAGQAPFVLRREIAGFVVNRLQGALLEETFRLVADGICSTDDVDIALKDGLALRWSFMGPFEAIDLNAPGGVRDYVARYQRIYIDIFKSTHRRADWAGPVLDVVERERRAKLPADGLSARQRWRDVRLMALLRHKSKARDDIGN